MAASIEAKAAGRAVDVEAAIREALAARNPRRALHIAVGAIESEAKAMAGQRPGDGAYIYAQLAGTLSAIAAGLHAHKPRRPRGCPPVPGPPDLAAAFDAAAADARADLEGGAR